MKRYNLIIAVVLALALVVSGAEAKKPARLHEQLHNVSYHGLNAHKASSQLHNLFENISIAISKFKKGPLSEEVAPGLDGDKGWSNDVPVNDVPPYYDPNVTVKSGAAGTVQDYGGRKPIRWFMRYQAVRNSD